MTPIRPHIDHAGSYTVTQASSLLGIDRKTLRRYESAGLVVAHCNQLGRRKYMGRELLKLWEMNY
jgi:DNA-binding transcriptional MerR regulator